MIVKAPGKVVLSGAYAVLEGAPAIVTAVDRYVIADSSRSPSFVTEEVQAAALRTNPWFDATALRSFDRKLGLGSSAAILVASVATDELEHDIHLNEDRMARAVFQRAFPAHKKAQPLGSGIDVAACCFGGTRTAKKRDDSLAQEEISLPPNVHIEIWGAPNACSTHNMLLRLNEFRRDQQKLYSILLLSQADASEQALFAIQSGSANRFVDALAAQRLALEALGRDAGLNIVTSELSALADVAANESAAVLPAGAGGGDVAVFVGLRPPSERLRRLFVNFQLEPLKLSIGARGVHRIFTREFSTIPITNPPKRD